jgi:hypothetical protein
MVPGYCGLIGRMSRVGWGRWAASGSGSRAPSRPSKASSGWTSTAAAPWWSVGPGRQRLLALATGIWWNWEIGAADKRSLVAYDH